MKNATASILILGVLLTAGCQRETAQPAQPAKETQRIIPEDVSKKKEEIVIPLEKPTLVEAVSIGKGTSRDGTVPSETDSFAPGELIVVTMKLKDAPKGSAGEVIWFEAGAKRKRIARDRKDIPVDAKSVTFQSPDTSKWKPGSYRVEAWMGGDQAADKKFTIAKKKKP